MDAASEPCHTSAPARPGLEVDQDKKLSNQKLSELRADSPLGEILAAGLSSSKRGREIMKECIEEAAARVVHDLSAISTPWAPSPALHPCSVCWGPCWA